LGLRRRRIKALAFGVVALAYACLISYASSMTDTPELVSPLFFGSDKLAHFVEFWVMGALLFLTFAFADLRPWDSVIAVTLGAAYGIVDEYHQSFVPGRTADPIDAAVNVLGVLVAVALLMYVQRRLYPAQSPASAWGPP